MRYISCTFNNNYYERSVQFTALVYKTIVSVAQNQLKAKQQIASIERRYGANVCAGDGE